MRSIYSLLISSFTLFSVMAQTVLAQEFASFPHSEARLVSDGKVLRGNGSITLGLHIKLEKDWHSYWSNSGDSGAAPIFSFRVPSGIEISPPIYPTPERIDSPPLTSFGYSEEVVYLFEAKISNPQQLPSPIVFELDAEWLVCKIECVPAFGSFSIELMTQTSTELEDDSLDSDVIAKARASLPVDPAQLGISLVASQGKDQSIELEVKSIPNGVKVTDFFPSAEVDLAYSKPIIKQTDANSVLELERPEASVVSERAKVTGLIILEDPQGRRYGISVATSLGGSADQSRDLPLLQLLLFAFLGGLLLNFMPCVFPIISIKLLGIAQHAHGSRRMVQAQCLAYIAGVVVSFVSIGLLLVALRSSGMALGWGFQLQSPYFLAALSLLFSGMAMSFLGLYELNINVGSRGARLLRKEGVTGQFFTGVLSTVVASPCTAPFMGVAMGVAISQSIAIILSTFAVIGLGLASPYLIFAVNPRVLKIMPKPGTWMESLRQFMAFPLFATAIWLLWLLAQVANDLAMIMTLSGTLLAAMALWIRRRLKWRSMSLAVLLLGVCLPFSFITNQVPLDKASDIERINWLKFDEAEIARARSQGNPVFVEFTADWCITCKVNERLTFANTGVQQYVKENNIMMFRADWTRRDPLITAVLTSYQRIGVPLYLYWAPHANQVKILPEVLTPTIFENETVIAK